MSATSPASKANLLVVDDTPASLRLLANILTERGYKVRPAPSGKLAISAAQGQPPDLILLDITMPEMSGYEVCDRLKQDERTREIPIIFISALSEVLDKVTAFRVGGVDYITKPFQVEEVLSRVETHLSIRSLQKRLQEQNQELERTLQELQASQSQLVQSEKMAALGKLVAGVAHEINTPLGAIRSSIENIDSFLSSELDKLPDFILSLAPDRQTLFATLLARSGNASEQIATLSNREKRQYKRALVRQLETSDIQPADNIADSLVDMGIVREIEDLIPLLSQPEGRRILDLAYQFSTVRRSSKTILTATDRAAKVVFALKSYSRYKAMGKKEKADLARGIETVLTLYHHQLKKGIDVVRSYADLPPIPCYADELGQVWTNLIHNALQAMEERGTLAIATTHADGQVAVSITDSGKGIPDEVLPRIFEPFFTTKPTGEGSGLGLDISRKIVEKHGGRMTVESVPGQTTFTVYLPLESELD